MYGFIYFYMVKLVEKRNPDHLWYSASFVFLNQIVHFSVFLAILKKIFDIQYPVLSHTYLFNKLLLMPFALIWLIAVHIYFKRQFTKLSETYLGRKIVTLKNTIIVFSLLLVPLVLGILLSRK